jgi:hypothetical protein
MAIFAAIIAGVSALASARSAKKGSKAQQRGNEAQREINKLKNKQSKRAFMRKFRQAQAMALQQSIARGIGLESSVTQGTRSSQLTQGLVGVTEFNKMGELGGQVTDSMNAMSKYQAQAQTWGAVSSFASQFIAFGSGKGDEGDGSQ